ncbi:type II toxin-antitoxin system RelE/ParE family toxin [Desulfosporosinus sp. FKB]|uniref:type II toxin-antitoxin system RelE/ParE family toxin n=1 Tax=Desulfosporosinus sp. FKB TaxID=1969835 RepID=UPI000B49A046|nr:type II toxin-antitoxin system RelE/ParE family toxin [Desulfosporosinus sp. FKB]
MMQYRIQITNRALADMEAIYNYIAEQLQASEVAMGQYNRIADAIETLVTFPERVKLMETEEEYVMGLRQMSVDNFSVFFNIREERVIITNVLYSASDIDKRLRDS